MNKKWLTPLLLVIGAILLITASALNHTDLSPKKNVWIKISGLIILMFGLYHASKRAQSKKQDQVEQEQIEIEEQDEDQDRG